MPEQLNFTNLFLKAVMCGLIAVLTKQDAKVAKESIYKMTKDLWHRGPDDEGYWFSEWLGFGFRRLAILDITENGHQPMFDISKDYVIVYNGEIYNFKELKEELANAGVKFFSNSDTEVVLNAYIHWGAECLNRFIGMFAFVIARISTREVFIARDPLGIKPLYYCEDKNFIFFSSEIKAFRHVIPFALNNNALYEQFVFRYVSGENTLFSNVYEMLPGYYIKTQPGQALKKILYKDITETLYTKVSLSEEETLAQIHKELKQSIQLHTVSDVGFNMQLSGGIDSSLVTAIVTQEIQKNLHTYSVTFKDKAIDESRYQQIVADKYHTKHHALCFKANEFSDALEKATWHMDTPVVHMGCILLMLLCQKSYQHSKVILTGEGADELFGGYSRYMLTPRVKFMLSKTYSIGNFFFPFILTDKKPSWERILQYQLNFNAEEMLFFISGDLKRELSFRRSTIEKKQGLYNKLFAHDQKCYLDSILNRQDKMSMASSVEARVPFCNHKLFEIVNSLPNNIKFKNNTIKYCLKKISEKYLPQELIYRRKNGFLLPLSSWMQNGPLCQKLDILTDHTTKSRGLYNMAKVEQALNLHRKGTRDYAKYLCMLLMFEIWLRVFIDDPFSYKK